MGLAESGEMYLETILVLSKKHESVRAIDVVDYMGYSKPSVSRAMGLLREGGFISVERDGAITLTDAGREVAEKIYERHTLLTRFFMHSMARSTESSIKSTESSGSHSFKSTRSFIKNISLSVISMR